MTGPQTLGRPIARRVGFSTTGGVLPDPGSQMWVAPLASNASSSTPGEAQEQGHPVFLWPGTLDTIGAEVVTTAGSAGAVLRFGIRGSAFPGGRSHMPTAAVLLDAGTVSAETTGFKSVAISFRIMVPGIYWLTCTVQGAATTRPTMRFRSASTSLPVQTGSTTPDLGNNNAVPLLINTSVTGALPATAGYTQVASAPSVAVRYVA